MDEGQLSELFAEAAEDAGRGAPPAGFDREAVLAGSARAAARARKWQTGAVAAAVILVAGAGLAGVQGLATEPSTSILAEPAPSSTPTTAPSSTPTTAPRRAPNVFVAPKGQTGTPSAPGQSLPNASAASPNAAPGHPAPERYAAPNEPERAPGAAPDRPNALPDRPNAMPDRPNAAPGRPNEPRAVPAQPYAELDQPHVQRNQPYSMPEAPSAPNQSQAMPERPYAMRGGPGTPNPPDVPRNEPRAMPGQPNAPVPYGAPPGPFDARARPGAGACGPDHGLFDQVVAVFPAVKGAVAQPLDAPRSCPGGARAVQVRVNDHGAAGVLRVLLVPAGSSGFDVPAQSRVVHSETARTAGDARLIVWVTADEPGRIPFAGELAGLARTLAARNH